MNIARDIRVFIAAAHKKKLHIVHKLAWILAVPHYLLVDRLSNCTYLSITRSEGLREAVNTCCTENRESDCFCIEAELVD